MNHIDSLTLSSPKWFNDASKMRILGLALIIIGTLGGLSLAPHCNSISSAAQFLGGPLALIFLGGLLLKKSYFKDIEYIKELLINKFPAAKASLIQDFIAERNFSMTNEAELFKTFEKHIYYSEIRFPSLQQEKGEMAEAYLTVEMSHDSDLPVWYKKRFTPKQAAGASGTFFICDRQGTKIGVFKAKLLEQGMKDGRYQDLQRPGLIMGTCWTKEILAYQMDKVGCKVPMTQAVAFDLATNWQFDAKFDYDKPDLTSKKKLEGSYQKFISRTTCDISRRRVDELGIPLIERQRAAAFHLRLGQGDGNSHNFLYRERDQELFIIDNGIMLFDTLDPNRKGGMIPTPCWSQAFDWSGLDQHTLHEVVTAVEQHNIEADCRLLRENGIHEGAILTFRLRSLFLKEGMVHGKTLKELGEMAMQSQVHGKQELVIDRLAKKAYVMLMKERSELDQDRYVELFRALLIQHFRS